MDRGNNGVFPFAFNVAGSPAVKRSFGMFCPFCEMLGFLLVLMVRNPSLIGMGFGAKTKV